MPRVFLPAPLRDKSDGSSEVDMNGGTAGEVVRRLETQYPGLRGWVLDERGHLREHVKLFLNDSEASLETPVTSADQLHIVPAISGGVSRKRRARGGGRAGSRAVARRGAARRRRPTRRPVRRPSRRPARRAPSRRRRSGAKRSGTARSTRSRATPRRSAQQGAREAPAELLVGTRKGLLVLRGPRNGPLKIVARAFAGMPVEFAVRDARTGTYLASVTHWQFGPHIFRTTDPRGEWEESVGPAFPDGTNSAVARIWVIEAGVEPGVLWAGVDPAALFQSTDDGRSWTLNRALWDQPTRPQWQAGAGGLCLHSICTWPGNPLRMAVGISAAGVWITADGGNSWRWGVRGLVPRYVPEEARATTTSFCVHNLKRARLRPQTLYMQFHGGVYRSDDAGETWTDIGAGRGLPSDFGFPLAVDVNDADSAFVIPLTADMDRVTPEGKLRVYETRDGGGQWRARGNGLPNRDAYVTILRQAFCADERKPLGLYFGTEQGELFGSSDGGRTWGTLAMHLPPILSVRASA